MFQRTRHNAARGVRWRGHACETKGRIVMRGLGNRPSSSAGVFDCGASAERNLGRMTRLITRSEIGGHCPICARRVVIWRSGGADWRRAECDVLGASRATVGGRSGAKRRRGCSGRRLLFARGQAQGPALALAPACTTGVQARGGAPAPSWRRLNGCTQIVREQLLS
jgi:hypothetical protein